MSKNRTTEIDRFAEMFKALGNSNRLTIFLRLLSCCPVGTRCVSEAEARRFVGQLGEELDIAPSTLSHHLKELRHSGLIRVERHGKNVECWVDPDVVAGLADLLTGRQCDGGCREGGSARAMVPTEDEAGSSEVIG